MRRLGRILFLAAAALSLLLCLAAGGMWVRGYFAMDIVTRIRGADGVECVASRGRLSLLVLIGINPGGFPLRGPARWDHRGDDPADPFETRSAWLPDGSAPVAGFFFHREVNGPKSLTLIMAPTWSLVLATAILPLSATASILRRRRRRRRLSAAACPACGYDCRATPGRCPECGHGRAAEVAGGG